MNYRKIILIFALPLFTGMAFSQLKEQKANQHKPYHYFEDSETCLGCHVEKYEGLELSQHSRSFTGDFFQKQLNDIVIPSETYNDKVKGASKDCIGCHSPTAFLAHDYKPTPARFPENMWKQSKQKKTMAERGVNCDFCHTVGGFENFIPFNHDYISDATEAVDPKYGDLEFPWSPHHETKTSDFFEAPPICATCHNEQNPYGVWVKATEHEYTESVFPQKQISCQVCHMQHMGGKPTKMGINRPHNTDHWFGGGFANFVEGAARVKIDMKTAKLDNNKLTFNIEVQAVATGHKFPTGSVEQRDVWLHVTLVDKEGKELLHIPVPKNPNDPNDQYFITSNEKIAYTSHSDLSEPIVRDALPEGDRVYHSAFLDDKGKFTYAQWFAVSEIENRLNPLEIRSENYSIAIPDGINIKETLIKAQLNYRRMPDSFADYLQIDRRPVLEVARDLRKVDL